MPVLFTPPSPRPVNCIAPPSPPPANGITPPSPLPANGAPQTPPQEAQASASDTPWRLRIDHAGLSPSAARSTPRRFFESALNRRRRWHIKALPI
ncbi:LOW QUALITY PROTEIN: hypothetical protein SETIT_9G485900v2 [Setaria italica]|uniref:Uncharacterized protein n=1 Tax=Setaria italica TaxID=4555 RepID=A0A368STW9_SETIT|nr:LOW QUALITY PROTEIN: hypothetical protein SETIT_9G485900v2 [Setaria italica]